MCPVLCCVTNCPPPVLLVAPLCYLLLPCVTCCSSVLLLAPMCYLLLPSVTCCSPCVTCCCSVVTVTVRRAPEGGGAGPRPLLAPALPHSSSISLVHQAQPLPLTVWAEPPQYRYTLPHSSISGHTTTTHIQG